MTRYIMAQDKTVRVRYSPLGTYFFKGELLVSGNVFPIKNGDIPASYVSLPKGILY